MFPRSWRWAPCLLLPLLALVPPAPSLAAAPPATQPAAGGSFAGAMQAAAQARGVPLPLIEAIAYVNTRWEWIVTPEIDGGVGPMKVTPSQESLASSLSGHTATQISTGLAANLDAGAALLASHHSTGTSLASWRGAVAATQGSYVTTEVYDTLRSGASRTTSTGETITLAPQSLSGSTGAPLAPSGSASTAAPATTDYPGATWVPADPSNYSVANRAHDYPIDLIVIHDIEGSSGSAIQLFQTPNHGGSAHYVVSYSGAITQMVREKDIAWHAGNWDYNTRSIGIEHAGYAAYNLYTTAEYNASAALAASICSRWGVVLDRNHVIGHYQVPDPNHPGLYGGTDHHTDPGPYWNWSYYMATAQADAARLPSPPHLMPDPVAVNGLDSVTVSWQPARTCRPSAAPITGYTVVASPGGATMSLPANATSATFTGLTQETTYTFTVTAHNSYGDDSQVSNPSTPGRCNDVQVAGSPPSPQPVGTAVTLTASSSSCPNPQYEFWILAPGASLYTLAQAYSSNATYSWSTAGLAPGAYQLDVWARDAASPGNDSNAWGAWDGYNADHAYSLIVTPCTSVSESASPAPPLMAGMPVTVTAAAAGCGHPSYEFWILKPGASLYTLAQTYGTSPTLNWSTAGLGAGTYRINVWARDASSRGGYSNSYGSWDSYDANLTYTLTAGCPSVGESASPPGAAMAGAPVTVTAAAPGCSSPTYEFWVLKPGATLYTLAQAYSASPTLNWSTSGLAPGTYRINVWVKDASSAGTYGNAYGSWDAYDANLTYALTQGCPSVSDSASPAGSATVGATVTVTASAPGCPSPEYEFWILYPGASLYTKVQDYSSSPTLNWNTTGRARGVYRINVWVRQAGTAGVHGNAYGGWDAYDATLTYTLN